MAFDVTIIVIDSISWSDFEPVTYGVGESVDIDLWSYLQSGFGGIVTRDSTGDAFPMSLMITSGRYLRGTVSELGMFNVRFIATENGESATSGEFMITVESAQDILWTDGVGNALWVENNSQPLWIR